MDNNVNQYEDFFYESLSRLKEKALSQKGTSDIDHEDYDEKVNRWYDQIASLVSDRELLRFIKEIVIVESPEGIVDDIRLKYFPESEEKNGLTIVIESKTWIT